ncbi:MAG: ABC transporter substrate-binding protein [Thermoplasmata archaeon]|nr:ABC transporter substrate-binding protein [Thermoplasmata archaeon]MCI4359165.1 ABC transporter substrate-binding protein [Thermoplasmata archaeon]
MTEARNLSLSEHPMHNPKAMSMPTAIVVMAVVLVVVGAGSYAAFSGQKPTTATSQSCVPVNSPACVAIAANHDVAVLSPFAAAQTGQTIPFSAILPTGASATSVTFNFGDGSTSVASSSTSATHSYSAPGTYIISVQATIKGAVHDNYNHLEAVSITATSASGTSSNVPAVSGKVTANSTPGTGAPSAVIGPGGTITFAGAYTASPSNPLFVITAPSITASGTGVTVGTPTVTPTTAAATVTFSNSGVFTVTFVGSSVDSSATPPVTATQDYVWTAFVAPTGVHASAGGSSSVSPHKGQLQVYELVPGGSRTHDPSTEYDSASGEVVSNLYQTLIQYNGSAAGPDPNDFVPDGAACVPGAGQCGTLFPDAPATAGTDLVNPATGAYTFVLTSSSQFYDAKSGKNWGVYPSDVLFTLVRTEAFSNLPFFGANNGWLTSQALLNGGSSSWDGGIHGNFNNTPSNSFSSILVNASAYCPPSALSNPSYHGCVTFLAKANGLSWPFFLELIADPTGTGIEPCGWFSASAQGAGVPDWTATSEYASGSGDRPCLLPGDVTSTDAGAFTTAVNKMGATDWDSWQNAGSASPYVGNVQFNSVGSGPYYMQNLVIGASYKLAANPAYVANPTCTWTGCMPAKNGYPTTVTVIWEPSSIEGEQAYQAGTSDASSIPTTETAIMLQLLQQGKIQAVEAPTISIYFWPMNFNFNLASAQKYTTNPITVPSDFFSHQGVRQFFVHAFPYGTVQSTINTVDGITFNFGFGGAIPKFMGAYYPTNVSWPQGDPSSNANLVGSAAWWWAQSTTPGTPYYDSELTSCTTSSPCTVPWFGETGAPNVDEMGALLQSEVSALSGGRLKVTTLDINFANLVGNINSPSGQNPMPMYQLGWAPDYPDPTDYVAPLYQSPGPYTSPNAVGPELALPVYNQASYPGGSCPSATDYVGFAHMVESMGGIPDACQGHAYAAMEYAMSIAAVESPGAPRVLLYNFVEQIANGLALYVYWGQTNLVFTAAPWIDPSTPNTSVMFGGGNEQTWWTWNGNGVV